MKYHECITTCLFLISVSNTIVGFAGAAGHVEGRVRCLNTSEEGNQLQPGEVLVAVTTNIGWTPLFPRLDAFPSQTYHKLSEIGAISDITITSQKEGRTTYGSAAPCVSVCLCFIIMVGRSVY